MNNKNSKLIYPELSYKIYGLCFQVQNELDKFRSEKQYADVLEYLLKENKVKYEREKFLPPSFKGENKNRNKPDFIIEDLIVIDFKAKRIVTKEDYLQMKRYLISYNKKLGLIINFHQNYLTPERVINNSWH